MQQYLEYIKSITVDQLAWCMIATGVITLVHLLVNEPAKYGRYSSTGWGLLINHKLAWFTQECPSFLVPVLWIVFFATPQQIKNISALPNAALLALFLVHYFNRDFIYPFRLKGGKPTPLIVWAAAFVFCLYNGTMQTMQILNTRPAVSSEAAITPHFIVGVAAFITGWLINLHSDQILLDLRKGPKDKSYKIPRGGFFEYISCANYFGELVEWSGFAIASWNLPAVAFAWFTFANLVPRAVRHHEWYKSKFPRYPKKRKAIIPFLW